MGAPEYARVATSEAPGNVKLQDRRWKGHWAAVCGDGDPQDVAAGCLAWNVPAIAFGWNLHRGLQLSFWREAFKFLLLTVGIYLTFKVVLVSLLATCPAPAAGALAPSGVVAQFSQPLRHLLHKHHDDEDDKEEHHHEHRHHNDEDEQYTFGTNADAMDTAPYEWSADGEWALSDECAVRVVTGACVVAAASLAAVLAFCYYAARRRQQLREVYGIPGTFKGDLCLWFWCSPCALAQETRTLMHHNVHEGVWYGPLPGNSQESAMAVPVQQIV